MTKKRSRACRKAAPADPAASQLARWREEFLAWEESGAAEHTDKVIEAKLRVSQGYYDRPDVQEQILRAILRDLVSASDVQRATDPPKRSKAAPRGQRRPKK